jgi:uncharacterized surface protein with fasciclin (FAS1) repeats
MVPARDKAKLSGKECGREPATADMSGAEPMSVTMFRKQPFVVEVATSGLRARTETSRNSLLYSQFKPKTEKVIHFRSSAYSRYMNKIEGTKMKRRFALKGVALAGLMALVSGCATGSMQGGNIVDVASSNDDFSTLVAAVSAAGLVETLQGGGPFTVFAPTNSAFAALPAGTLESLLLPENKDKLVSILTYHVVAGSYPASSLTGKRGALTSVQGGKLHVNGTNGVEVENSTVVIADVAASNGVIHAIDKVMLP